MTIVDVRIEEVVIQSGEQCARVSGRGDVDGLLGLARVEREGGEAAVGERKEVKAVEEVVFVVLEEEAEQLDLLVPRQRKVGRSLHTDNNQSCYTAIRMLQSNVI